MSYILCACVCVVHVHVYVRGGEEKVYSIILFINYFLAGFYATKKKKLKKQRKGVQGQEYMDVMMYCRSHMNHTLAYRSAALDVLCQYNRRMHTIGYTHQSTCTWTITTVHDHSSAFFSVATVVFHGYQS